VTGLPGVYAAPTSDEADDDVPEDDDEHEGSAPPVFWHTVPLWRLGLFSFLGGPLYQSYWMYRAWGAYRLSWGYSERIRWEARYEANGFRVSAFWRAALFPYSYCLLVVVGREARLTGVTGLGPAWLWSGLHLVALMALPSGPSLLALSFVFLPAQSVMNRLHERRGGDPERPGVTAGELCWLGAGFLALWTVALSRGWP
jgi:hypothetical protein